MKGKTRGLRVLLVCLLSCGGPTRRTESVVSSSAVERAFSQYFAGDLLQARLAFEACTERPACALGRAQIAAFDLDYATCAHLARAALAASSEPTERLLAETWAGECSRDAGTLPAEAARHLVASRSTGRLSFLPELDLERLAGRPPDQFAGLTRGLESTEPTGRVTALGQLWDLKAGTPKGGTEALTLSEYPASELDVHFEVRGFERVLIVRAGRIVASPSRGLRLDTLRFSAPGGGPLLVVWSGRELPTVRVHSYAAPAPLRDDASLSARFVALGLSNHDGDLAGMTAALHGLPPSIMTDFYRSQALDPGLTAPARRDHRRAAMIALAAQAPAFAHRELAKMAQRALDLDATEQHLKLAQQAAPQAPSIEEARFKYFMARGWHEDAAVALVAAQRLRVSPCVLVDQRQELARAQGDGPESLALVSLLTTCGREREAIDLLLELDQPQEALNRLDGLKTKRPDDDFIDRRRLSAFLSLGTPDALAQAAVLDSSLDRVGVEPRPDAALALARRAMVRLEPTARETVRLLSAFPELSPVAALEVDETALIGAYRAVADEPRYEASAVRVVDHSTTLYYPNGDRLRFSHEVIALRTREAVEALGELTLPEDALAVEVYTRKPDGRIFHAEDSPEKASLSLPGLEVGDFIVARYLETGDNGYLYDTGLLTPRIFFRSDTLPTFLQRTEILSDPSRPMEVQLLLGASQGQSISLGELRGLRFEVHQVGAVPAEPDGLPPGLLLPSVRLGFGVRLEEDLAFVRDRLLGRRGRSALFDAWAVEVAGSGQPSERAERLTRAVRARVQASTGLIADDVVSMWASGEGHRALVLSVALEAVGIAHELLLARPRLHVPAADFLQVADFPYALLRLSSAGASQGPLIIDPGPSRGPVAFVPFPFLGGDAVIAWPPFASSRVVELPRVRAVQDARAVKMKLHLSADGNLSGSVDDRLTGQEAIVMGDYLSRLEVTDRSKVMERLLVPVVGAATVSDFQTNLALGEDHLSLTYTFKARTSGPLSLGLFPVSPGRAWASLTERRTPLVIELPTEQRVQIELTSDGPIDVSGHLGTLKSGSFKYTVQTVQTDKGFEVSATTSLPGQVVSDEAYADFAEWARAVDARERLTIRSRDTDGRE